MAGLVLDASVASAWCFPDERTAYVDGVFQAAVSSLEIFAPRLWTYEIRNSILMGLRRGRISKPDAERFLAALNDLNVRLSELGRWRSPIPDLNFGPKLNPATERSSCETD